jgi:hypothetical protein
MPALTLNGAVAEARTGAMMRSCNSRSKAVIVLISYIYTQNLDLAAGRRLICGS